MSSVLQTIYPTNSRPKETIFERNHNDAIKDCLKIAKTTIDKLDNDVLYNLIQGGQDWAFHGMPILGFASDKFEAKYITQILDFVSVLIEQRFGKGFDVRFATPVEDKIDYIWLDWSTFVCPNYFMMNKYNTILFKNESMKLKHFSMV